MSENTPPPVTPEPTPEPPVTPAPTPEPPNTPEPTPGVTTSTDPPTAVPTETPDTTESPSPTRDPDSTNAPTGASTEGTPTTDPPTGTASPLEGTEPPTAPPTTESSTPAPTPTASEISPGPTEAPSTKLPTTPFPTVTSNILYFDEPEQRWSTQLNTTVGPGKGNGVTISPDNGLVYVTLKDGSLEVLEASTGERRWGFKPDPNANGWEIRCESQMYFGELPGGGGPFAVYAIIDKSPLGSGQDDESRVVAVTHGGTSTHLWTSAAIPGVIQGTPILTRGYLPGKYIYVTRNTDLASTTTTPVGHFTVLDTERQGAIFFTEASSEIVPEGSNGTVPEDIAPYSPLGVAHEPNIGNWGQGQGTSSNNDVVIWVTSTENGFSGSGFMRAFQLPAFYEPADGTGALATARLRDGRWSGVVAPTLSADGLSVYLGVLSSQLRGWVDRNFDRTASWQQQLTVRPGAAKTPIQNSLVLSKDEQRLYVPSAGKTIAGVDSTTGIILWEEAVANDIMSEARVSPDDQRVYIVQSVLGLVTGYDQFTGAIRFAVNCATYSTTTCSASAIAESEFSISENGLVLYYGDSSGQVSALQLGTSLTPTSAPTDYPTAMGTGVAPSSASPSMGGTLAPTGSPSVMQSTDSPTRGPTSSPAPTTQFGVSTPPPTFPQTSGGVSNQYSGITLLVVLFLSWLF